LFASRARYCCVSSVLYVNAACCATGTLLFSVWATRSIYRLQLYWPRGDALRCTDWNTAATFSLQIDFIVHAKLAFLIQCYPKQLVGMPNGFTSCAYAMYSLSNQVICISANLYLQTGIKSNGDCADLNMTLDRVENTFAFVCFVCCCTRTRCSCTLKRD
jgi:hypothetical protein